MRIPFPYHCKYGIKNKETRLYIHASGLKHCTVLVDNESDLCFPKPRSLSVKLRQRLMETVAVWKLHLPRYAAHILTLSSNNTWKVIGAITIVLDRVSQLGIHCLFKRMIPSYFLSIEKQQWGSASKILPYIYWKESYMLSAFVLCFVQNTLLVEERKRLDE